VTAYSENGGAASYVWTEDLFDPVHDLGRYERMQEVWREFGPKES
jgi:hypothetical protein